MKAFYKANWLQLCMALPAAMATSIIYNALAVFFMPNDIEARGAFEAAVRASSTDIATVAFFGVIAYTAWRWRSRHGRSAS